MLIIEVSKTLIYIIIINIHILSAHYVPDIVLSTKDTEVKGHSFSSKSS